MPFPIAAAIGAGASLLGGLIGRKSTQDANKQNIALQKQFAQEGIQWKVEDARKAGIHPLYALGAQTASFAPNVVGDTSLPTALTNMGQDISRAVDVTRTSGDRVDAYEKTVRALQLTRLGLENDLLASQIAKVNQAGGTPGMPNSMSTLGGVATLPVDPRNTPAQEWENQYGEAGDWVGGVGNMLNDVVRSQLSARPPSLTDLRRVLTDSVWPMLKRGFGY